ncbi:MAG: class IIb bacteriocin, lactobin A/cerein 7B family [Treponema sp.]|nr:class IIb bacteriocin, lactobin A/cerein 7B family [Treponema sp.]
MILSEKLGNGGFSAVSQAELENVNGGLKAAVAVAIGRRVVVGGGSVHIARTIFNSFTGNRSTPHARLGTSSRIPPRARR